MMLIDPSVIRDQLNWAAGLFDGEGYARVIFTGGVKQPVMSLSMTHFGAVQKFYELFDVGSLFVEQPRKAHYKPALKWQARSRHALIVAEMLCPLCVVKQDDLRSILQHYADYDPPEHWYKKGQIGPTAKLTPEDVRAIRKSTEPGKVLAAKYGIGVRAVSNVRTRTTWAHVED